MKTQDKMNLTNEEFERRIDILRGQSFYIGNSYFPKFPSKSNQERFEDCVNQIKKYGWPDFNYLLYGMDVKTEEENDKYVNAMEFVYRRNYLNFERNPINSCVLLRNKYYFGIFAKAIGIKTPNNIAYIEHGYIYNIHDSFKRISFKEMMKISSDVFCKSNEGENGVAVYHLQQIDGNYYCNGIVIEEEDFSRKLGNETFIVQEKILQHPEMDRLYPTSINTIRLDTVRSLKTGDIYIWPSIMRMGTGGSHIDNGSQGGIMVNINLETGYLAEDGYIEPQFNGRIVHEHPDTGVVFSTFKIPYFKDACKQAIYFHSKLKDIHSIGWDVVITSEGPAFIEGNDDWEILDAQLGGGVRNLFERDFF